MDQIITAWAKKYHYSVFYNFPEEEDGHVCIITVYMKGEIETHKGVSKFLSKHLDLENEPNMAKILAQSSLINSWSFEEEEESDQEDENFDKELETLSNLVFGTNQEDDEDDENNF